MKKKEKKPLDVEKVSGGVNGSMYGVDNSVGGLTDKNKDTQVKRD